MADIPERHTLLIVTEGTVMGSPPATAACLAVICPLRPGARGRRTPRRLPMGRHRIGQAPPRSPPRPVPRADSGDREPPYLPIGVRAIPVMTLLLTLSSGG